jgi:hypothetical protein
MKNQTPADLSNNQPVASISDIAVFSDVNIICKREDEVIIE